MANMDTSSDEKKQKEVISPEKGEGEIGPAFQKEENEKTGSNNNNYSRTTDSHDFRDSDDAHSVSDGGGDFTSISHKHDNAKVGTINHNGISPIKQKDENNNRNYSEVAETESCANYELGEAINSGDPDAPLNSDSVCENFDENITDRVEKSDGDKCADVRGNIRKLEASIEEKDCVEAKDIIEPEDFVEAKDIIEPEDLVEAKDIIEPEDLVEAKDITEPEDFVEAKDNVESKNTNLKCPHRSSSVDEDTTNSSVNNDVSNAPGLDTETAEIVETAKISGAVEVVGNAEIVGNADIVGNAEIAGTVEIDDNDEHRDDANHLYDEANRLYDDANRVLGDADQFYGDANQLYDDVHRVYYYPSYEDPIYDVPTYDSHAYGTHTYDAHTYEAQVYESHLHEERNVRNESIAKGNHDERSIEHFVGKTHNVGEETFHEMKEYNDPSDDANNINKCKSEIDSRIKRKMHPLKQNEEKKKKKKDDDNIVSPSSDSSDNGHTDVREKNSDNSYTSAHEKKNKEEKEKRKEKKKNCAKEDYVVCADEVRVRAAFCTDMRTAHVRASVLVIVFVYHPCAHLRL
ncbi:nucleic acid binding protein, putative [Plasmodium ovale wallikeri]|uniref:Nucleic acid binding protein, putative n=1 Tax=Plasmodium ovale wallikeri TaxID=864142 RepID=A0A1A8YTD3_PLAOA|nr:nucleic acid binding protein, putative [Plasmodium ovale wallikeri]